MIRQIAGNSLSLVNDEGTLVLQMEEQLEDQICTVKLTGSVNNNGAYDVFDELDALLSVGKGIVLDIEKVTHLSGTFVRYLITLQRKIEKTSFGTLPILNASKEIMDDLAKDGLDYSLDISAKEG